MVIRLYKLLLIVLLLLAGLNACASTAPAPAALALGEPTPIVVRILDLDAVSRVTPTLPPTFTPLPTQPATSTSAAISGQAQLAEATPAFTPTLSCRNAAEFVKNLNIGDNAVLKPGEPIAKIWQIRNIGDCVWDEAYTLVLIAGEALGAPVQLPLSGRINPGETLDLRVDMVAPDGPGTYTGSWMMQTPTGERFGVGIEAVDPLLVSIVIKPQPRPTPS